MRIMSTQSNHPPSSLLHHPSALLHHPSSMISHPISAVSHQPSSLSPWYILWVHPRTEKSVRDNLIHNGYEAFAATRKEVHTWRRRERRMVEKVIIPSVVFVRMEKQDRIIVERMTNVSCLMRDPARKGARSKGQDEYACISEDEIHLFRQMLEQEEADVNFTTTDFTIGEYVHIKDFPEGNNIAQIVRIYNDNKTYVGLRVSFLGCAYMQVPLSRIIKIDKS